MGLDFKIGDRVLVYKPSPGNPSKMNKQNLISNIVEVLDVNGDKYYGLASDREWYYTIDELRLVQEEDSTLTVEDLLEEKYINKTFICIEGRIVGEKVTVKKEGNTITLHLGCGDEKAYISNRFMLQHIYKMRFKPYIPKDKVKITEEQALIRLAQGECIYDDWGDSYFLQDKQLVYIDSEGKLMKSIYRMSDILETNWYIVET